MNANAYYTKVLSPLIGMTIGEVAVTEDGFPFLVCRDAKGNHFKVVYFYRDPEGNGPGHAQVETLK